MVLSYSLVGVKAAMSALPPARSAASPALRAAARFALLVILAALFADSLHLATHALPERAPVPGELCVLDEAPLLGEAHLHRIVPVQEGVCIACLWHGMGKVPPPLVLPLGLPVEVTALSSAPPTRVSGGSAFSFLARAPPSA